MPLTGLLIDAGTVAADRNGFPAETLRWRHEPDAAVAVLVVVPLHERHHPAAGLVLVAAWPSWVIRPVFDRSEQRLREGLFVADPRSGEGSEHPELLQAALQPGGSHGIAVVGMEDQGLRAPPVDPLTQAGLAHEVGGDLGVFPLSHLPGHDFAAPNVDHQVEVEPVAPDAGGQLGDVPAPELIRPVSPQPRNGTRLLRKASSAAAMVLPMGRQALIGKDRNDLPRRQGGEFLYGDPGRPHHPRTDASSAAVSSDLLPIARRACKPVHRLPCRYRGFVPGHG
jgi:hypothetical protein